VADAGSVLGENDDRSDIYVVVELVQSREEKVGLFVRPVWGPPEENDARAGVATDGEQLAEVGVHRDQAAAVVPGGGHDVVIWCAEEPEVADVDRLVAGVAEQVRDASRERFVDEELQLAGRRGTSRSSTAAAA